MSGDFLQFSYVTNDFDRAIDLVRQTSAIGPFKEMRELRFATGPDRHVVAHVGLAFKAGLQFEIIQPLAEDTTLYQQVLGDSGFEMVFHHVGRHIPSPDIYHHTLNAARARWELPVEVEGMGGFYAYVDARQELGHFLEYFCFPGDESPADAPHY